MIEIPRNRCKPQDCVQDRIIKSALSCFDPSNHFQLDNEDYHVYEVDETLLHEATMNEMTAVLKEFHKQGYYIDFEYKWPPVCFGQRDEGPYGYKWVKISLYPIKNARQSAIYF